MKREEANRRVMLSRTTIQAYEGMGRPVGPPEDTLRMISEEITILEGIVAEFPTKAGTIGNLIERYRALAEQVKAGAH